MIQSTQTFSNSWGRSITMFLIGAFMAAMGIGAWISWDPLYNPTSAAAWCGIALFELCFTGIGLMFMVLRQPVIIDPGLRRVHRMTVLCGVLVNKETWSYSDFSSVKVTFTSTRASVHRGGLIAILIVGYFASKIKTRTAMVMLMRKGSTRPIMVGNFSVIDTGDDMPPEATPMAKELAETLGIPIEQNKT